MRINGIINSVFLPLHKSVQDIKQLDCSYGEVQEWKTAWMTKPSTMQLTHRVTLWLPSRCYMPLLLDKSLAPPKPKAPSTTYQQTLSTWVKENLLSQLRPEDNTLLRGMLDNGKLPGKAALFKTPLPTDATHIGEPRLTDAQLCFIAQLHYVLHYSVIWKSTTYSEFTSVWLNTLKQLWEVDLTGKYLLHNVEQ